jgi:hypothetical protein
MGVNYVSTGAVEERNVAYILRFKNITLRININSQAGTQFIVTTSSTGAIHRQRTTLFLILTVTIRTDLCSHSNQQVDRRMNMAYDEVHGPPDDKQSFI